MNVKAQFALNSGTASKAVIKDYQMKIGSLTWIALITCVDVAYVVNVLSQFALNPLDTHHIAISRVFHYLRGSINY
jgi:hypothetical protein